MINPLSPRLRGIKALYEAIATVPIPGAPPQLSNDGAAVGLAFLDIALRQNHIRRLTERLTLVEHRTARCVTEVDISLGMLDAEQQEAGLLYQRLRSRTAADLREAAAETSPDETSPVGTSPGETSLVGDSAYGSGPPADPALAHQSGDSRPSPDQGASTHPTKLTEFASTGKGVMWVPVSLARRTHAPIDVISASGAKVPRLTQFETSRLLASAMYRLFRLILQSHPDATEKGSSPGELNHFLHRDDRTRWLIQAALVTLLTERNKPAASAERPKDESGEDLSRRKRARWVFERYGGSLREYKELLDLVVNDYLLVVALDPSQEEHLLSFDSPLHIELKPNRSILQWFRMANGPYWVRYETRLPANLRAYHLVAETEQDLEIDTMCLRTDADASVVGSLRDDLRVLADRLKAERGSFLPWSRHLGRQPGSCDDQKVELELQACLVRLAELMRRRTWDASRANLLLPRWRLRAASKLAQAVTEGPASGSSYNPGRIRDHRYVTHQRLARAARQLGRQRLSVDFSVENEPPNQRAHVYWRRARSRVDSAQYINVSASMFVRDISGQRSGSITAYVLSVVAIAYALAAFRYETAWPFGGLFPTGFPWPLFRELPARPSTNPAAAITVMLLVPGFLYTRLNLPRRHTIAGQLRRMPRFVAHITIAAAAAVATALAATEGTFWVQMALAFCMVVPLVSVVLLHVFSRGIPPEKLPITRDTPAWARRGGLLDRRGGGGLERGLSWRPRLRTPDSSFRTTSIEPPAWLVIRVVARIVDWFRGTGRVGDRR